MTGQDRPSGYSVPPVVVRLVEHAEAHGWRTLLQWCRASEGEPFLKVEVGRRAEPGEGRGPVWRYSLTWHSWDLPHGRLRLFRAGTAETPEQPRAHDAPSVKRICGIIAANPAPAPQPAEAGAVRWRQPDPGCAAPPGGGVHGKPVDPTTKIT